MIEIDGSFLSGGGQIARTAVPLAALLRKSVRIYNIRAGRPNPGLNAQHMCGIQLVNKMVQGTLTGCYLNSPDVVFEPGHIDKDSHEIYEVDTGTAGSTMLLIQIALPVALFRRRRTTLNLKGGTDAKFAPTVDYFESVFLKYLEIFGAASNVHLELLKRGYFPRGGGHVILNVKPLKEPLKAIQVCDFGGGLSDLSIEANAAGRVPEHVAAQMAAGASQLLNEYQDITRVNTQYLSESEAYGDGSSIFVKATTLSGCILSGTGIGSPGLKAGVTGRMAAENVIKAVKDEICLDSFTQDQVIILMALAEGKSKVLTGPITMHTKTVIHVVELMTNAKFKVTEFPQKEQSIIECQGIGFFPRR